MAGDGGAEQTTKGLLDKQSEKLKRLLKTIWDSTVGKVYKEWKIEKIQERRQQKREEQAKEKELNTDAVELCRDEGRQSLLKSSSTYSKDAIGKIAARAKRDGVKICLIDINHPDKKYTLREVYKIAENYERIVELEELLSDKELNDDDRDKYVEELKLLEKTNTIAGQIQNLEDQNINIQSKLDDLVAKGTDLTSEEQQLQKTLSNALKSNVSQIEKLELENAPTFHWGCNELNLRWFTDRVSEEIGSRTESKSDETVEKEKITEASGEEKTEAEAKENTEKVAVPDMNGDDKTDELVQNQIQDGKTYKTIEELKNAKEGQGFGSVKQDIVKEGNYCTHKMSLANYSAISKKISDDFSFGFFAEKTDSDSITLYFSNDELDKYISFKPSIAYPIQSCGKESGKSVSDEINESASNKTKPKVAVKTFNSFKELNDYKNDSFPTDPKTNKVNIDYQCNYYSNGTCELKFTQDALEMIDAKSNEDSEKKTLDELNKEIDAKIEELQAQQEATVELPEIEEEVDITDGVKS